MAIFSMPISERLECLQELLSCTGTLYRWVYDAEGKLLETNCPDRVLDKFFISSGCKETVLSVKEEQLEPIIVSVPFGLNWSAAFETENDELKHIHVLGPITTSEFSFESINHAIHNNKVTARWRPKLLGILRRIPIVSTIDFFRHTLMLHYCITGEKLTNADIVFREVSSGWDVQNHLPEKDRGNTYMIEQALMRMVREGDMNYKSILHDAASASRGVKLLNMGSMEQIRISEIVFVSLCTRAAIEGGISPEIAYTRGDAYIQDIMECKTIAGAAQVGHTMYDDFVHMVHKSRTDKHYSAQIQGCCDYIDVHVEEKLSLSEIARRIGYVEYYLSRKFKAETGVSLNDYIKTAKVERAKTLLIAGNLSIQEICDRLNFGSRSFFSETFKEITGVPPALYREQNTRL